MAGNANFISATVVDVGQILDHIEQAQALAAARYQEYVKMDFGTLLQDADFTGRSFDKTDFLAAITSLSTLFPNILGFDGTNLYMLKE